MRRAARLFAVVALLAHQALLPTLHFAAGDPIAFDHSAGSPHAAHGADPHHHASRGREGHGETNGASHQICHFCRLFGAALPPPPTTVVERIGPSGELDWPEAEHSFRPEEYFQTGRRTRAPPTIV